MSEAQVLFFDEYEEPSENWNETPSARSERFFSAPPAVPILRVTSPPAVQSTELL